MTRVAALIVAAGRGTRALAAGGGPKQYVELGGSTVLARTIQAFHSHVSVDAIQVVIHADDMALYLASIAEITSSKLLPPAVGGVRRQDSVRAGLEALSHQALDHVLIHDAARPFVTGDIIDRVLAALETHKGAIAATPVADTLKLAGAAALIAKTVPRDQLWAAQTPQGFQFEAILGAHRLAFLEARPDTFTDDAQIAERAGVEVALVPGSARNMKLTTAEDIRMAAQTLGRSVREVRTGQGFDVHRFTAGDHVWLCGVKIPHTAALEGHSDADVGLHALTDALLGTIGDGDIGVHFPPSDPQWKGAASHVFLSHAAKLVAAQGGTITNVDITILCEAPKITPHRDAMRARVAQILGLDVGRVGVKATTTERLGFTGRREGIAAMAIATVTLPA